MKAERRRRTYPEEGDLPYSGLVGVDSAGGESWTRKEAKEESGKRSEMAEMRSEVPRHAEEIRKMERQRRGCLLDINENFASKEATLLLSGMDSAGGVSLMRKEAKEESGKRSKMQYEWMKRPEESEASYEKRLREERRKDAMGSARGLGREALGPAGRQREINSKEKARTKPKVEAKDAVAGKGKPPVTEAGKPEESVTEAGKAEESLTVGSGKSAMNQQGIGLSHTDNEEILKQVFKYKLDRGGNSYAPDETEEKERWAMLKDVQERMARVQERMTRGRMCGFHWLQNLPTKDEESAKAERPVTVAGKPEESALDQDVISDNKESLEQVRKDKLDLEEDSNRTTEPAADPNSMTIQDDHVDGGKSELAKKTADEEAKAYRSFRKGWESECCIKCDHFEQITLLGSMQYTHCTPGLVPHGGGAETLQIFSMKLKLTDDNAGGFKLPLSVYGMVAVRDTLDSRRNILFSCSRTVAQELTQDDPFLLLTGPSRAIVSAEKVYFEIRLKVKGATASQDKPLMTRVRGYLGGSGTAVCFDNVMCTLEVCLRTVQPAVQATIVCVQIFKKEFCSLKKKKKELWPSNFIYGGLVACTPLPARTTADSGGNQQKIVLIESKGGEMLRQGDIGYVHLRRQVVSVECGGGLDVVIQAYGKSGAVAAEGHIHFWAQNSHMSQKQCTVGETQVNVTVAWSVVPTDMDDVVYSEACGR